MNKIVIIGAGPAGLSTGYSLSKEGQNVLIIEKESRCGGLCRTFDFKGFKFDIGPHIFKERNQQITGIWKETAKDKLLTISPTSKLFYNKKFLTLVEGLFSLQLADKIKVFYGLVASRIAPIRNVVSSKDWAVNSYGKKVYSIFYKTHEEKFWGIDLSKIDKKWAMIHIRKFPLHKIINYLIGRVILKKKKMEKPVSDAINYYPESGSALIYEALKDNILKNKGSKFKFNSEIISLNHNGSKITSIDVKNIKTKKITKIFGTEFISTMPITELVQKLNPSPPRDILKLTKKLFYRHLLLVNFIVNFKGSFPCQWAEVHSPEVKFGRITNFKNFSKHMADNSGKSPICMEYYCFEGDSIWKMKDEAIISFAKKELDEVGLINQNDVEDGFVVKLKNAYPMYIVDYEEIVNKVKSHLVKFKNLQTIGRGGMYRYNNMGHSVESGLRAAENIMGKKHNLWEINVTDDKETYSGGNI